MKLRLRATKLGKVRFTSHRDAARIWERALRRADLPIVSSQGFTPRPRISFGLALPTGAESIAEFVDVDLVDDLTATEIDELPGRLSPLLPTGFDVLAAQLTPQGGSLQEIVTSCTWQLWGPELDVRHHREACQLLEAASLPLERERKGKRSADDVRPLILDLRVSTEPNGDRLIADLATRGRGLRPNELARLAYPHVDPVDVRVLRTHQWTDDDGDRRELLPIGDALPTVVRTSAEVLV